MQTNDSLIVNSLDNEIVFCPRLFDKAKNELISNENDEKHKKQAYKFLCFQKHRNGGTLSEEDQLKFDSLRLEVDNDSIIYNKLMPQKIVSPERRKELIKEYKNKIHKAMETFFNRFFVAKIGGEIKRALIGEIIKNNALKKDNLRKVDFYQWILNNFPEAYLKNKNDGIYIVGIELINRSKTVEELIREFILDYPWQIDDYECYYDYKTKVYTRYCDFAVLNELEVLNEIHFGRQISKYVTKNFKDDERAYFLKDCYYNK